jgi:hypothetical protein
MASEHSLKADVIVLGSGAAGGVVDIEWPTDGLVGVEPNATVACLFRASGEIVWQTFKAASSSAAPTVAAASISCTVDPAAELLRRRRSVRKSTGSDSVQVGVGVQLDLSTTTTTATTTTTTKTTKTTTITTTIPTTKTTRTIAATVEAVYGARFRTEFCTLSLSSNAIGSHACSA